MCEFFNTDNRPDIFMQVLDLLIDLDVDWTLVSVTTSCEAKM